MTGEPMRPQLKPKKAPKAKPQGLKRSGPMRRGKSRRQKNQSSEERAFMDWLHTQECCAKGNAFILGSEVFTTTHWCFAGLYDQPPVQAAHFRDHTGMGRKESDLTAIPLCREMHDDYDGRREHFFKGWPLEARKRWHRLRQIETQAYWAIAKLKAKAA